MTRPVSEFVVTALWLMLLCVGASRVALCQQSATKTYRGSIGGNHIEMVLNVQGNSVSGTYSYDRVRQNLELSGKLDAQGKLELTESGARGKPTGKIVCKRFGDPVDYDCNWSRPDGTGQTYVELSEQHNGFSNGLRIVPKLITDKKKGVNASYPQITGGGSSVPAVENFNRRLTDLIEKVINEFESTVAWLAKELGRPADRTRFETNYNVLLATDDLVSVEISEYMDTGGAHPSTGFQAVTYDLSTDKELKLEDLFKSKDDYKDAIARHVVADINRRAVEIGQEDALAPHEPLVSIEELPEIAGWGMTPTDLVVYFDFPQVIAVFDKNLVPYSVIKDYLRADGPAARFASVR